MLKLILAKTKATSHMSAAPPTEPEPYDTVDACLRETSSCLLLLHLQPCLQSRESQRPMIW
jgi:hypothetical protein